MKREWLVELRGDRNQEEIAKLSNTSRSMYVQIETGDRTPSVKLAKRIAAVLGVDWTVFFNEKCHETCN